MMKTFEQINQEFFEEYAEASSKAAEQATAAKESNAEKIADRPVPNNVPVWKELLFLLLKVSSICLVIVLLFTFLFGITHYQDYSMEPAIKDGDLVLFFRYAERGYEPGDVVVLDYNGQTQARRVIATAGDIVDVAEGGLWINGALQQEFGIYMATERYQDGVDFPLVVPEGQIFVLGDHRQNAADSRIYGCVAAEDTLGKAISIIRHRGI